MDVLSLSLSRIKTLVQCLSRQVGMRCFSVLEGTDRDGLSLFVLCPVYGSKRMQGLRELAAVAACSWMMMISGDGGGGDDDRERWKWW